MSTMDEFWDWFDRANAAADGSIHSGPLAVDASMLPTCEYCGGTRRDEGNPKRCYGCGHEAATPAQTVSNHPFLTPNQHALDLSYQAQLQNMNPPFQSALGPLMVRRDGIADEWLRGHSR